MKCIFALATLVVIIAGACATFGRGFDFDRKRGSSSKSFKFGDKDIWRKFDKGSHRFGGGGGGSHFGGGGSFPKFGGKGGSGKGGSGKGGGGGLLSVLGLGGNDGLLSGALKLGGGGGGGSKGLLGLGILGADDGLLSGLVGPNGIVSNLLGPNGLLSDLLRGLLGSHGLLGKILGGDKCNILTGLLGQHGVLGQVLNTLETVVEELDDVVQALCRGGLNAALKELGKSVDTITDELDKVVDEVTDFVDDSLGIDLNSLDGTFRELTESLDHFVICLLDAVRELLCNFGLNGIVYEDIGDLIEDLLHGRNFLKTVNGLVGNVALSLSGCFDIFQHVTQTVDYGLAVLLKGNVLRYLPVFDGLFTRAELGSILEVDIDADILVVLDGAEHAGFLNLEGQLKAALKISADLTAGGRHGISVGLGLLAAVDLDLCDFTYDIGRLSAAVRGIGNIRLHQKSPGRALADSLSFAKSKFAHRGRRGHRGRPVQRRLILNVCDWDYYDEASISIALSLAAELRRDYGCEIVIIQQGEGARLSLDGTLHLCASLVSKGLCAVYKVTRWIDLDRIDLDRICNDIICLTVTVVTVVVNLVDGLFDSISCFDFGGYEIPGFGESCTDLIRHR